MLDPRLTQPIMIVEDNDDDFEATERALKYGGPALKNTIIRCEDGRCALNYLMREGKFSAPESSPRPGVILLDLNMPGISGHEVLIQVKSNEHLRDIPVVILTTSENERDIDRCYAAGANTYIKKPVDLDNFFAAIRKLREYWFDLAILPKETP